jgi:hypothetical protein
LIAFGGVLDDLEISKLWVVYPGSKRYFIHEKVEVMPFKEIPSCWKYN